jgi:hypothetical protein
MTTAIDKGRWYPAPAPALDGETDDAYTDRLTGADGTGRSPYDHPRNRQCSIGWHSECSVQGCECPHHDDKADGIAASAMPGPLAAAGSKLARLYDLPEVTGLRVISLASAAAAGAECPDKTALLTALESAYGSRQTDGFITDAVNIYRAALAETAATDPRDDRQLWGTGDLARFLGGSEDSFTGLLLVLFQKADPGNLYRLRMAFPEVHEAWETWNAMSPAPTARQLREALTDKLVKRTMGGI